MDIIGWFANILFFAGGFYKNPRITMRFYIIADIAYVVMYLTMGLYIAALSIGVCAARTGLSLFLTKRQNFYSTIILTAIAVGYVLTTIEHGADILILAAAILIGLSCIFRDNYVWFKGLTCLSQVLWIVHSLIFGVYPMIVCCTIVLGSNLGSLLYHYFGKDALLGLFIFPARKSVRITHPIKQQNSEY